MEAKKSFTKASTLGSKDQLELGMDPSMLTIFLETCMKLLHERKEVKGLQELITRCVGSGELRVIQKLGKHALRTGTEMRLTAQIGEYEMDQVILDLGSDANVIPKKMWEPMETLVAMVPNLVMNGEPTKDFSHGKIARGDS